MCAASAVRASAQSHSPTRMAQTTAVETVSVRGLWWREIDSPEDLAGVRSTLGSDLPLR